MWADKFLTINMKRITPFSLTVAMVVAVIAFSFKAQAQSAFFPGYIILLTGDTIKGEVKMNPKKDLDLFSKVTFKKGNEAPKVYKANKVKEYKVEKFVFVSRNIEGEQVFIKRISTGLVNLYEWKIEVMQMNDIKEKVDYFMEKVGEVGPVKIKSSKFKKQVADAMGDNEEILKGLENKKYDFENIVEVFEEYNKSASN